MKKIKPFFQKIAAWLKALMARITPGGNAMKGAAWMILALGAAYILVAVYAMTHAAGAGYFILSAVVLLTVMGLSLWLILALLRQLFKLPRFFLWAVLLSFIFVGMFTFFSTPSLVVAAAVLLTGFLLGAGMFALLRTGWQRLTVVRRVLSLLGVTLGLGGIVVGILWLVSTGHPVTPPANVAAGSTPANPLVNLADPSAAGDYPVAQLTYGSGTDRHRVEFGDQAELISKTVDGSGLVGGWSGLRTAWWGFDAKAMPLNGRVWYPAVEGKFPLVLIVHGNHEAEDFSDPGYAYLGEHLASRGYIVVSVDENFINSSMFSNILLFNGLKQENDLRGWLLLEHLVQWKTWAQQPGNPFYGRVDWDNIALAGHSRGGEAVTVAAAFNQLRANPDDATMRFNYGFNIRAVVAIAPVDGQYRPGDESTQLKNVNYLVLHGAHDMDVSSFHGYNVYDRLAFTDGDFHFKSTIYIYRANHGQFNSTWGNQDSSAPMIWMNNIRQLMPMQDQQQIAKTYITAFLDASLRDETGFLPLFEDYRNGWQWLPDTVYMNAYADSNIQLITNYEEDQDVMSSTLPDGEIEASGLTLWRESRVPTKWGSMFSNSAVFLGWQGVETPALYQITLPDGAFALTESGSLIFNLAHSNEPADPDAESAKDGEDNLADGINFGIVVEDVHGNTASLQLADMMLLQPQLEAPLFKAAFMESNPTSEPVFQTFSFPLTDFLAQNPALDVSRLTVIRFVFNLTPSAVIVLDDIGFRLP